MPAAADNPALALLERFNRINRARLDLLTGELSPRQADVVALLPLLWHCNHPTLPGFVAQVPTGIQDYAPDQQALLALRRQLPGRAPAPGDGRERAFSSLLLMGSGGSVGFKSGSDFDLWLCCRTPPDAQTLALIESKASAIEDWAGQRNLEIHLFVVTPEHFLEQIASVSEESSGSAQNQLLLDEFYRTALLLAGLPPRWWATPLAMETGETSPLPAELMTLPDFGPAEPIPLGEFHGAALWQVSKGLHSPHKAILKILLMEAYAAEHPDVETLSRRYKRLVQSGETDLQALDPYVLLLRKVEEYLLASDNPDRIELARRCLYLKSGEKLSRRSSGATRLPRQIMATLVREWRWDGAQLRDLDDFQHWDMQRLVSDYRDVVAELTGCYSRIAAFARHDNAGRIDQGDMTVLGRKIYSAFENKPGKIELIHYPLPDSATLKRAVVRRTHNADGRAPWLLEGIPDAATQSAGVAEVHRRFRRRFASLEEVLVWGYANRAVTTATQLQESRDAHSGASPQGIAVDSRELQALSRFLERHVPAQALRQISTAHFRAPSRLVGALLLLNVGVSDQLDPGRIRQVARPDPLRYGEQRRNLVTVASYAYWTSWGALFLSRFTGERAVAMALEAHLNQAMVAPGSLATLPVFGYQLEQIGSSPERLQSLVGWIASRLPDAPDHRSHHWLFPMGNGYGLVAVSEARARVSRHGDLAGVVRRLGKSGVDYGPCHIEPGLLDWHPLGTILSANEPGQTQVFLAVRGKVTQMYITDERGALFFQQTETFRLRTHMHHIDRFLAAVQRRQVLAGPGTEPVAAAHTATAARPKYYRLSQDAHDRWRRRQVELVTRPSDQNYQELTVSLGLGGSSSGNSLHQTLVIRSGGQEFSSLEYGHGIYDRAAGHILAQRRGGDTYSVHITDIDPGRDSPGAGAGHADSASYQTIYLLQQKKRIETLLTESLRRLAGQGTSAAANRLHQGS